MSILELRKEVRFMRWMFLFFIFVSVFVWCIDVPDIKLMVFEVKNKQEQQNLELIRTKKVIENELRPRLDARQMRCNAYLGDFHG